MTLWKAPGFLKNCLTASMLILLSSYASGADFDKLFEKCAQGSGDSCTKLEGELERCKNHYYCAGQLAGLPDKVLVEISSDKAISADIRSRADTLIAWGVATALDKAVDAGNLPEVQRLVAAGADVNVEGGKYSTSPLYEAVTGRHKDIAEFLIANKANVKEDHRNLLYMVSSTGDADWVRLLVANGADVNAEGVCQTGPPDDMEVAPATGCFEDSHGWTATPLAIASAWGHKSVVEALLDGGAGIDFKTKSGRTALMWASYYGQLGTVQTLLARGANLNIALEHTVSVSFIQFANGAMAYKGPTYTDEQFSALAQSSPGAILHRAGVEKETALSLATSEGHADVRDALIKAGAK